MIDPNNETYLDDGLPSSRTMLSSCDASNPCPSRQSRRFSDDQEIMRVAMSVVVRDLMKERVRILIVDEF